MLTIGERVPDFAVPDSTGRQRTLTEMTAARSLALVFFAAGNDPRCVRQLRDFSEHLRAFNAELVNLAAVAVMSTERGDRLRHALDVRFPMLCDADAELCRAWGLLDDSAKLPSALPGLVVVDREGKLLQLTRGSLDERPSAAESVAALQAGKPSAPLKALRPRFADRMAAWRSGGR
ncbi:MAG: hypothetical protein DHS20C15_11410 [Planctomycetota bacterium]|nr:MAG: hypothetical protein DHS20C15_11410 [Planctomycetota bacterium]